jgi:arsenate reductase (thioredoxin)
MTMTRLNSTWVGLAMVLVAANMAPAGAHGTGPRPLRVLFLCTGNSARSQMSEGLLRSLGGDRFQAFSAGTHPAARVNPLAVETMRQRGLDISSQHPKPLSGFAGQKFDLLVTVCDNAARECPNYPGAHMRLHWSEPDPAAATGTDEQKLVVFKQVADDLESRIRTLITAVELGEGK